MSHVHKKLKTGELNVVHPVIEGNLLFATKYSYPNPQGGSKSPSLYSPYTQSLSYPGREDNQQTTDRPLVSTDEMGSYDPQISAEQNSRNTLGPDQKNSKSGTIRSRKFVSGVTRPESKKSAQIMNKVAHRRNTVSFEDRIDTTPALAQSKKSLHGPRIKRHDTVGPMESLAERNGDTFLQLPGQSNSGHDSNKPRRLF